MGYRVQCSSSGPKEAVPEDVITEGEFNSLVPSLPHSRTRVEARMSF